MLTFESNQLLNNRYVLQKRIGSGGFSIVWKASDEKAGGMPVAIKIFMPDKGLDPKLIKMFQQEYEFTRNLDDNRLVKITDYFVINESPCLVMPYCSGGSLYDFLQKNDSLNERDIAKVLYQISGALHYLHSQEIPVVHLDIKPENILIDYSGNFLLSDFGISQHMRSTMLRASNTQGETFAYSSPERSETHEMGTATDVFALGIMIYELCTGSLPWGGMGGSAMVIGLPKPELPELFTRRLQDIMHACMDRYPKNRPSAFQMEELARKFLDRGYWDEFIQPNNSSNPTPAQNLEKATNDGVFNSFIHKIKDVPSNKQKDDFFFELNKKYGNLNRDGFNNSLQKAYEAYMRETKPTPPPTPIKPKIENKETNKSNKNKILFYILGAIAIISITLFLIFYDFGSNDSSVKDNETSTKSSIDDNAISIYNTAFKKSKEAMSAFALAEQNETNDYTEAVNLMTESTNLLVDAYDKLSEDKKASAIERINNNKAEIDKRITAEKQGKELCPTNDCKAVYDKKINQLEKYENNAKVISNNSITNKSADTNGKLKIGDNYAGGIIFYIDKTGKHGKVCATNDQSKGSTWDNAKRICSNLTLNGFSDWYLPSKDELKDIYEFIHQKRVMSFAHGSYWSSTAYGKKGAWVMGFDDGYQNGDVKDGVYYVRAVRAF